MIKSKLKNGIKVIVEKKKSESVVIELQVNVGANNENDSNRGISHLIEHMLFEGTKKRKAHEISNEIERLGGELNAFTSHDRTSYYVVVPRKNFDIGLEVISDIIQIHLFDEKSLEKEKKVIIDEINLIYDDPKYYQFVFFLKNLFKNHPIRHPISGYKETVSKLTRTNILDYYKKHYISGNMALCIVGNVKDEIKKANIKFNVKQNRIKKALFFGEPLSTKQETITAERKIAQSYLAFGYKMPYRNSNESYVIDVIRAVLARGQSGRLFNELRVKRGLCYIVGAAYEAGLDYGYFIIYVGTDKKNINEVISIIKNEINALQNLKDSDINEAKTFIEGSFAIENEDSKKMSDNLVFWNMINDKFELRDYVNSIKKVSRKDILNVAQKYFNDKYLLTILKQA